MSYSDGCGYAACTIKRGTLTGECRCLGAGPICKGGHQNMRKQLREAVRLLDEFSTECEELQEKLDGWGIP
ncbi:hypothetical protein LCGC14_0736340 [marine sediment metagenome]|uniref:Uncharacterized protein n=1 Tax=marine sediment metagenome TaxID=412755 RepID=A0A0F9SSW4_9ZZZZ